jgi:hypothetical protein
MKREPAGRAFGRSDGEAVASPRGIEKDTDDGERGHETEGQMEKKQANGRVGTRFRGFTLIRIGNTWEVLYYLFPFPRADERRELGLRRHLRRLGFMALGRDCEILP